MHPTSIRIPKNLAAEIDSRGKRSTVINRDLERLYTLYDRALRRLDLTVDEACLIVDALNGTIHDVRSGVRFWIDVQDAIELEGLAEKWNVDGKALIEKLTALDELSCMAIVDAAERFWYGEKYRDMDIREAIKKVFHIVENK